MHLPDDLALPNLAGASTERAREGGFMAVVTGEFEPALTPDDIGWLAGLSDLPVVVKGVQRADDAVRCVEAGAAAVVVSNHGARQLDDAPATADILAEVVDAVAGRAEVYVDGGIRRAPDVVKALALGARAVLVGRPSLWALATGGADGVAALLRWFETELRRTMALCGAATVEALDRGLVRRTPGFRRGRFVMTTVAAMLAARAEDDRTGVLDASGSWTWRQAVAEGAARGALARSLSATARPTSASCSRTAPNTCSGSTGPRWPAPPSSASTRPGAARPWRRTSAPPTAPSSSPTPRGPRLLEGLDLGVDGDKVLVSGLRPTGPGRRVRRTGRRRGAAGRGRRIDEDPSSC